MSTDQQINEKRNQFERMRKALNASDATSELLEKATARPWRITWQWRYKRVCYHIEGAANKYVTAQANTELLNRAAGSFEAMREALRGVHDDLLVFQQEDERYLTVERVAKRLEQIRKALALADGGQPDGDD